ncbi:hypothetical protein G7046_g1125 [Stylonectria norvegica]|nr:hypothetical protein G7046_g1125 [Stylonectria norvegica]
MSVPAFSDIAKPANDVRASSSPRRSSSRSRELSSFRLCGAEPRYMHDLLNKDFYHLSATTFEFKDTAPNGVAFKVTGKSSHEKATSAAIEGKYTDKPTGTATPFSTSTSTSPSRSPPGTPIPRRRRADLPSLSLSRILGPGTGWPIGFATVLQPGYAQVLMFYSRTGLTLTQTWNTANALDTKLEVSDSLAKGLKLEGLFNFLPATAAKGAKFNLHFKQPGFHGRAFFDLLKGPVANVDAVVGHEGFLAGASAGYDANKAALTAYSAAVGYAAPQYSAAITASDNLSVFAASYYHKVNSQVEAGAKATWNSKTGNAVGLEVASKYRIDPVSFTKVKINDRGIAALAYNVLLREGVTLGLGGSFDTQKLDQATHKLGASFTFEG